MASEPVIVPPTPTVNQPSGPADNSPGLEQVQAVFDKIMPPGKDEKPPPPPSSTPPPAAPSSPEKDAQSHTPTGPEAQAPPETEAAPKTEERKIPSFLEEALRVDSKSEPAKAPEPTPAEDWPEELPTFKSSDEAKARYKNWRQSYDRLKEENKKLSTRPQPVDDQKVKFLEQQNQEMAKALSRFGVENNQEFQQQVLRPLHAHWNEAARIVKDAGGDPQLLANAMQMTGKAQFEALDELFQDMPESAKAEAHDALRNYRRFENIRRQALSNAPQTFEVLQRKELERQYATVSQQREEMKNIFENQLRRIRDEAKLEIFQTTSDPEAKWWNDQAKAIEDNSRKLYLENTDMDKMAVACILAPAVDAYRQLWLGERARRAKAESSLKEKFGAEPSLSESPGPHKPQAETQFQEDLKQPFEQVFLREFHKSQQQRR